MSTQEIIAELPKLNREELVAVDAKLHELLADEWDNRIAADAAAGKLDALFDEAEAERKAGTLRDWPGTKP